MAGQQVVLSPMSRVGTMSILVVQVDMVRRAASTARQNKASCAGLAQRVLTLGHALPAYQAAKDTPTRQVLRELRAALQAALELLQACQAAPGFFSSGYSEIAREAKIEGVRRWIGDCFKTLRLINDARMIMQNEQIAAAVRNRNRYSLRLTNVQLAAAIAAAVAAAPNPPHPRRRLTNGGTTQVSVQPLQAAGGGGASGGVHVHMLQLQAAGGGGAACDVRVPQHPTGNRTALRQRSSTAGTRSGVV